MFKVPTFFVIGAGAGFDVGMPLGDKLSRIVGEKLRITFEGNQQTDTLDRLTGRPHFRSREAAMAAFAKSWRREVTGHVGFWGA
jgi:hypothetical protein